MGGAGRPPGSSRVNFLWAVWFRPALIEEIDQVSDIQNVNRTIVVDVAVFNRIGSRAALIQVIYQERNIQNINIIITVGIAAHILTGITNSVTIGIGLIRIVNIHAVVADIADIIAVTVLLISVIYIGTVVIGSGIRRITRITITVGIRIRTLIALITVTITIRIALTRIIHV